MSIFYLMLIQLTLLVVLPLVELVLLKGLELLLSPELRLLKHAWWLIELLVTKLLLCRLVALHVALRVELGLSTLDFRLMTWLLSKVKVVFLLLIIYLFIYPSSGCRRQRSRRSPLQSILFLPHRLLPCTFVRVARRGGNNLC